MKIGKVFCLFEQSGTFKREFMRLGIPAEDYDILNDFGETDNVVDLFKEIENAYNGEKSIFDQIGSDGLVFAFFPCTSFEARVPLNSRGEAAQMKNWDDLTKINYTMKLNNEINTMYTLICKLFAVCIQGGWKMIVENPYMHPHYLTTFFPIKPKIIDSDRTKEGDHYKKPTQYWFVNCEPEQNVIMEPLEFVQTHTIAKASRMDGEVTRQVKRSMIHNQYARRFITQHILNCEGGIFQSEANEGMIT